MGMVDYGGGMVDVAGQFPADVTAGDDLIAADDATVGDDLAVTGDATVGGTLGVTGAITGATVNGIATPLSTPTVSQPARSLDSTFKPSTTRPTLCVYTVRFATDGGSGGPDTDLVELLSDAASPPTTVICQGRYNLSSGGFTLGVDHVLVALVQANHNVQLKVTKVASTTVTLIKSTEATL